MTALTETMRLLRNHRSIRKYTDEPIPEDTLRELIRCGQAAASSSFVQACSVIRVTNPDSRVRISEAAGGQVWVREAPEFLVYCADFTRIALACERSAAGELEGYTEHTIVGIVDAALMAQNVLLAAESLGLVGVYIGGIRNNPQVVVDCLELPEHVTPVFGMCLGWPDQDIPIKPRMDVDMILHQDRFDNSDLEKNLTSYDATMGEYYRSRGSNIKATHWSAETAKAIQGKKREHMLSFLQERGFLRR